MKSVRYLIFIFSCSLACATTWKPISAANENGTRFYVDVDSVNEDGKFTRAWVMENRSAAKTVKLDGKKVSYMSYVSLRVFDCERRHSAITQGIFYSEKYGKGLTLSSFTETLSTELFTAKPPSTMGEALIEYVCDKQTPHKIQT